MLNYLDEIDRADFEETQLKCAMVANGKFDHKLLFPDVFVETPKPGESELDPSNELDLTEVEWMSGSDAMSEWTKVMAALKGAQSGTIAGDAVGLEPTWTEWS